MDDRASYFCLQGADIVMTVDKDTNQGQDAGPEKEMTEKKDTAQITPLISAKDIADFLHKNTEFFNEASCVAWRIVVTTQQWRCGFTG